MRHSIRTLVSCFLLISAVTAARCQVLFEKSFPFSGTFTYLENVGQKFYLMDVDATECRLYNEDYSLYKTIKLNVPADRYLYDIQFVTNNFFDTDDGIELLYVFYQYVQTNTSYYYIYTTRVANEDGTLLVDIPGGAWTDILGKSQGSGMFMLTYVMDYSAFPYKAETRIYSIPGAASGLENPPAGAKEPAVYPNPTAGPVNVGGRTPVSGAKAEWVILNQSGQLVARVPFTDRNPLDLSVLGLVAGTYLVRLESPYYQTKYQQVVYSK